MEIPFAKLRKAGFFSEYAELNDEELQNELKKKRKAQYSALMGYDYEPGDYTWLPQLLAEDKQKFLDIDLEADVCAGNNVYVSLITDFSAASNGHFLPADITETWQSEEGPIHVTFSCNGTRVSFEPEYIDDWIDGQIFTVINNEMQKVSNEKFLVCYGPNEEWFGQNIIHIRLTHEEKQWLENDLHWVFPEE